MNINRLNRILCYHLRSLQFTRHHATQPQSPANYCLDSIRKYDYENFVCSLLLKGDSRACAIAVRGFNVEVARVAEQVSQETIGLMRLKFWEEAIEKCYSSNIKDIPKHPVAMELYKAINRRKLTKRYLNNLVACRRDCLKLRGFQNLEQLEKYCEQSVSTVYYLILEGCEVRNVHADHAASHLGKAQGIVQQLRSITHARRLNFLSIPQDILVKNKVSQEEILREKPSEKLNDCVYEVASRAHQHLMKARSISENVPKLARPALLPAITVYLYLDRLQKVNYDVFHPSLQQRSWKLFPQIWFASIRNKY